MTLAWSSTSWRMAHTSATEISPNFPMLTAAEAARFLDDAGMMGRVTWMKAFRRYVRDELAAPPPEPRNGAGQP